MSKERKTNKRLAGNLSASVSDDVQPSPYKRVKYTAEDANLAHLYDELANEVQASRTEAARSLVTLLSKPSVDQLQRVEAATTRLIKGLCSGRKAARLGFSIALSEVLRLQFKTISAGIDLASVIEQVALLTKAEGSASGQEKRDCLLGRCFAFKAILQSDVGLQQRLDDNDWSTLVVEIFDLAAEKQWLRRECVSMLYDYVKSAGGAKLRDSRVQNIVDSAHERNLFKTPEGVGLWIAVAEGFSDVKLPKGVWHHRNPLSRKERSALGKVMMDVGEDDEAPKKKSGSRQEIPSFAWTAIIAQLSATSKPKDFSSSWEELIVDRFFSKSASTERKALGLQILQIAIAIVPVDQIPSVLHPGILQCILDHRAESGRYLHEAAKMALNQIANRAKRDAVASYPILRGLLWNGAVNFDQLSKMKVVETVLSQCDDENLERAAALFDQMLEQPELKEEKQREEQRRMISTLMLNAVRSRKDPDDLFSGVGEDCRAWLRIMLGTFVRYGYLNDLATSPSHTDATRAAFRSKLMSTVVHLLSFSLVKTLGALTSVVIPSLRHSELGQRSSRSLKHAESLSSAEDLLIQPRGQDESSATSASLFMLGLCILEVYNDEPDGPSALEYVMACFESQDAAQTSTTLIELLLGFISRPSTLYKKVAEQVFSAFAASVDEDGLQSMIDILEQKESLGGQQALFEEKQDDNDAVEDETGFEVVDGEDASDVELIDGPESDESGSDEADKPGQDSDSSSDAELGADDDDGEAAIFDKKLADALGTAGNDQDSDDDGSDMDDEQMMALEPHLTTIFKERQKVSSKKKEKENAKENIVNFKNRVLRLLGIYVKGQYANTLALDLILPLVTLVRTTNTPNVASNAFDVLKQYFDACTKNKSFPRPEDHETCFEILSAVHGEIKLGGSKVHANACSRSSLFLSKVLVALDRQYYERIVEMYGRLQAQWYMDAKSKVQPSVFTEWTSWSIATRKQN